MRRGCVPTESEVGTEPDETRYQSEHEDELEGPQWNKHSFKPWALLVELVQHAVSWIGVSCNSFVL